MFSSNRWVLFVLLGFLSGSVMYSYEIPRIFKGVDVREASPDRNPGGMNAMRAAGTGFGLLCILLDILKAFFPVHAAVSAGIRGPALIPIAAAPVFGHAFSPFLKFHGGKAVSPFYGALLGLWPVSRILLLPAAAMVLFKYIVVIRPDSLCVCVSLLFACAASFTLEPDPASRAAFLLAQTVVFLKAARSPDPLPASVCIGCHRIHVEDFRRKIRKL